MDSPWLICALLVVALGGKMIGAGIAARLGGMNWHEVAFVASAMNGRGAVELVIASLGLELGVIDDSIFSILVVIAFLATLFPPAALDFLLKRYGTGRLVSICHDTGD